MGPRHGSRIGFAAAALCAALALLPASASAATVAVAEGPVGPPGSPPAPSGTPEQQATLTFTAAPAEANRLTVTIPATSERFWDVRLVDTGAPLTAGAGCSGGGAPGTPVDCRMHEGHLAEYSGCPKPNCVTVAGSAWEDRMRFTLGDGGSSLDATTLPEDGGNEIERPLVLETFGGAGNDTIRGGAEEDIVHSSPGSDLIETGGGNDELLAGPVPDGADHVDLGSGYKGGPGKDTADYGERTTPITWKDDGLPEDGAAGEGDDLVGVEHFVGGTSGDTLEGNPEAPPQTDYRVEGGAGEDLIIGGPGNDRLNGGAGNDMVFGLGGGDEIGVLEAGPSAAREGGNDRIRAGAGNDFVRSGSGDDQVGGGAGNDIVRLGPGADRGDGGAGEDWLAGEEGRDQLHGNSDNDLLSGGAGADDLRGDDGRDEILAGADSFDFPGQSLSRRNFLHAAGPLDPSADTVDCGGQRGDAAAVSVADRVSGCPHRQRSSALEVYGIAHQLPGVPGVVEYTRRVRGSVTLTGPEVLRRQQPGGGDFRKAGSYLQVQPKPPALRRLHRDGRVALPIAITLRRPGGGRIVRHEVVRLHLRQPR